MGRHSYIYSLVRRLGLAVGLLLVVTTFGTGCNNSDLIACEVTADPGGVVQSRTVMCPALSICVPAGCATPQEASACLSGNEVMPDGSLCSIPGDDVARVCSGGACLPAICGDGIRGFGEACDDGNTLSKDGCSAQCTSNESCGNGLLDELVGETCDDQNADETDGCHQDCQVAKCGDGVTDTAFGGESCDNGPLNSRDPDAACRPNCQPSRCGDGVRDTGEVCDDSNLLSGDGCSGDCLSAETCGNGYVDRSNDNLDKIEQCDDGNTISDDNCDNGCRFTKCGNGQIEGIEQCDRGPLNSNDPNQVCRTNCRPKRCGDGIQDSDEVCDDGNTQAGDRCSYDCKSLEICGNGIVDTLNPDLPGGEACDDPDRDKCTADCKIPDCGNGVIERNEQCDEGLDPVSMVSRNSNAPDARCRPDCRISRCGDFVVDPNQNEICDDGNNAGGDGCSADCRSLEVCGNGIPDPAAGEACDDNNQSDDDGCLNSCKIPGCGDGVPRADLGEECDLGPFNSNAPDQRCRLNCQIRKCGDGIHDADESCDDFNNNPGDGCSADCRSQETCGNGYLDLATGEACDDGNPVTNDGCANNCRIPGCGNGTLDAGEQCDDGFDSTAPFVNSVAPGARCRPDCRAKRCGDAVTDPGEACDDGNAISGDGCADDCSSTEACGNGIVDANAGEACDDGNQINTDACNNACRVPGCGDGNIDVGEVCDLGINNSNAPNALCRLNCTTRRCGDSVLDSLEACDDGNTTAGDGCAAGCDSTEVCGNGVTDALGNEACDDGNNNDVDGCRNNCTIPGCGDGRIDVLNGETCDLGAANSNAPDALCRVDCQPGRCGDGVPDADEICDDGNNVSADNCAGDCGSLEICGNGVVDTAVGEACDDGNGLDTDGCRNNCTIAGCGDGVLNILNGETCDLGEANSNVADALCRLNCQTAGCGDRVLDTGEVCDDGNRDSGDGCAANCLSTEGCGNGVLDVANGEQCDDGNASDRDGCHVNCRVPVCGDNVYDPQNGEGCDLGAANSNAANVACRSNCQPLRCGDGIRDLGEVCDDGNNVGGDNCSADCNSNETCPNGVVDPLRGEACDDGNANNADACNNLCRLALCGNGVVDSGNGEVCDLGAGNSNVANAVCRLNCQPRRCGDGVIDNGETCDDNNPIGGDGCSADCRSNEVCRNGVVDTGEQCDDNNAIDGDSCRNNCVIPRCGDGVPDLQNGESCDNGAANSNAPNATCRSNCQPNRCGDGVRDTGEVCDDGNRTSGDGCNASCTSTEVCRNGVVDITEACDDGNTVNTDQCHNNCTIPRCGDGTLDLQNGEACDAGASNSNAVNAVCRPNCQLKRCGDGVKDTGEQCDDGNTVAGDGCAATCLSLEVCGNGIVDSVRGEQCDDGNASNVDACHSDCRVPRCGDGIFDSQNGEQCDSGGNNGNVPNGCRLACRLPRCGDGVFDTTTEVCDDGNLVAGDGCSASCASIETCGNNVVDVVRGEQCDDGDRTGSDGCSSTCQSESLQWIAALQTAPPGRHSHAMVFDAYHDQLLVFGGVLGGGGLSNETWIWTGGHWENLSALLGVVPAARRNAAIAYDNLNHQVIMFGGVGSNGALADTWAWNGAAWRLLSPLNGVHPSARSEHAMAYQDKVGGVVLFGGFTGTSTVVDDTWVFSAAANAWTRVEPTEKPAARRGATLAMLPLTGTVLLVGGGNAGGELVKDAWVFNGTDWTIDATVATAAAERKYHAAAWIPRLGQLVIVGGVTGEGLEISTMMRGNAGVWVSGEGLKRGRLGVAIDANARVFAFGGILGVELGDWRELEGGATWSVPRMTQPPPRSDAASIYVPGLGHTIVATGSNAIGGGFGGSLNDAYVWDGEQWLGVAPADRKRQGARMALTAKGTAAMLVGGDGVGLATSWDGQAWTSLGGQLPGAVGPLVCLTEEIDSLQRPVVSYGGANYAFDVAGESWGTYGVGPTGLTSAAWSARDQNWLSHAANSDYTFAAGAWTAQVSVLSRDGAALVYDTVAQRTYMLGGLDKPAQLLTDDVWQRTLVNRALVWQLVTASAPWQARVNPALSYDSIGRQLLLFGGGDAADVPLGDTWLGRLQDTRPREVCRADRDSDGDGLAGCDDGDCAGVCNPSGCVTRDCQLGSCGDAVCSAVEKAGGGCAICPSDCGVCMSLCGDGYCSAEESTRADCPGDCN